MTDEIAQRLANLAWDCPVARTDGTFSHRQQILSRLTARALQVDRPCTQEFYSGCWLCFNLEPWNRVLHHVSVELIETEPGRLAIRSLPTYGRLYSDEDEFYEAAYVFSWLPEAHRCVQSIRLEFRGTMMFKRPVLSITSALGRSSNIRDLVLRGAMDAYICEGELVEGLAALRSLESLDFSVLPVYGTIDRPLADLLKRNGNHLNSVVIRGDGISQWPASRILRALLNCRALRELSLSNGAFDEECINCLSILLRNSSSLTKLALDYGFLWDTDLRNFSAALGANTTLTDLCLRWCPADLTSVLEALKVNRTLLSLSLSICVFDDIKAATLASALRINAALRHLELTQCGVDDHLAEMLAAAVEENCALETLDLRMNCVDVRGISAFSTALRKNKVIKVVQFCLFRSSQQERAELSFQMAEDKSYSRIQMTWVNLDIPPLSAAVALDAESPTELHLCCSYDLAEDNVYALLENLATNTRNRSIRSLEVDIPPTDYLNLCSFSHVAKALLLNTTVTEVAMKSIKSIAYLLSKNGTITKFTVESTCVLHTKRFAILSRAVARNRNIVEFPLPAELDANVVSRRVLRALRRNLGLLNLAVRFATKQRLDRLAALVFEELSAKASFLPHLMKVTGQSEKEAIALKLSARHYIRSNYLRLVGVVWEKVVCYPGPGTQADALNHECWCSIAKNLKLSDVVQMQPEL
ncbi:hypothetical protein HPB48_018860 [Haemaphysalis longicornis]|uniref:Uncharacterized protein n=1 Tax=Haemaphysalis longicornis TaxID=44386 RepID=A0A9J6GYA4_HAELO|nr:hypothetical protein HPB48_018860 [Haemaphysalis longicornis]